MTSMRNDQGGVTVGATGHPDHSTKERVLRVSAELFAARGYHATGMTELTNAIDLGRGGLYHHIGSKDALLFEISLRPITMAADQAETIAADDTLPPRDKVRALALDLVRLIETDPAPWIVFFREYSSLSRDRQERILAQRDRFLDVWEECLRRGAVGGDFDTSRPLYLEGLLALFIYSYIWVNRREPEDADQLADSLVEFVLRGVSAP